MNGDVPMSEKVVISQEMLLAKQSDDPVSIRRLLRLGENPNVVDEYGTPLLVWAAWRGYTEVVRLLLDKGVNIDACGTGGETPLMHAAFQGHTAVVSLLIERGADVNLMAGGGSTALIWASMQGHEEITKTLLAAQASSDAFKMPAQ